MSNLLKHADREFQIAGWMTPEEGETSIDPMNQLMMDGIKELLEVFANQGHSGFSGHYAISLFTKLAKFENISPLTGEDDEWNDMTTYGDGVTHLYQNKRRFSVFKEGKDGITYDSEGMIFTGLNTDGTENSYTSMHSRVPVTFPYTHTQQRMTAKESNEINKDDEFDKDDMNVYTKEELDAADIRADELFNRLIVE